MEMIRQAIIEYFYPVTRVAKYIRGEWTSEQCDGSMKTGKVTVFCQKKAGHFGKCLQPSGEAFTNKPANQANKAKQ